MPYKHPEIQSNSPYYDDFDETKNFLKVLFKPGYAVQARELTQVQSILQSQISKFADHIFVDGTQILGGKVNISPVNFIRVLPILVDEVGADTTTTTDSYLESALREVGEVEGVESNQILNTIIKTQLEVYKFTEGEYEETPSGTVLLLHYNSSDFSPNDNFPVLFFLPLSGNENGIGIHDILKVKPRDGEDDPQIRFRVMNPGIFDELYDVNPYGAATLVSVDDGIFYLDGMFVRNKNQIFAPYKNSNYDDTSSYSEDGNVYTAALSDVRLYSSPSVRLGLFANKTAITVNEDESLRDPSNGFYNANAPGADRYHINFTLGQLSFDPQSVAVENYSNSDFIQLARLVNGTTDWIRKLVNYSEILELFARRTYDESGSYTVTPFQMDVKNHYRQDVYEIIVKTIETTSLISGNLESSNNQIGVGDFIYSGNSFIPSPHTTPNFDFSAHPIAEVIAVRPIFELGQDSGTPAPYVLTLKPRSSKRITFASDSYGSLRFSTVKTPQGSVQAKLLSYNIDSLGAYSTFDLPVGDVNKMVLSVQPGKAYVYGFEYENNFAKNVDYDKGTLQNNTTTTEVVVSSAPMLGNYVLGTFATDTSVSMNVPWETLPKFQVNTSNLMTLILTQGEPSTAESPILSWSPYKKWTVDDENIMLGPADPRKYESVIFVEDNNN